MSKKIRALVDGVGGDVGQGVIKCLMDSSLDVEIHAACISADSGWLYRIEKSYLFPLVMDDGFLDFIVEFISRHGIDVYFPTVDSSLVKIAAIKREIEARTGAIVFVDEPEKIGICDDKIQTADFLAKNGFPGPRTVSLEFQDRVEAFLSDVAFPLIVKPRKGNGAKGVHAVSRRQDLAGYMGDAEMVLQEALDVREGEITSGIYIGDDGEPKGIYALRRKLRNGSTYSAERVIDQALDGRLLDIALRLGMKYVNIQAAYDGQRLLPFEFNGRFSGTTGVARRVFNGPEMFIRERILRERLLPSSNRERFRFSRYSEEIIYSDQDVEMLRRRS